MVKCRGSCKRRHRAALTIVVDDKWKEREKERDEPMAQNDQTNMETPLAECSGLSPTKLVRIVLPRRRCRRRRRHQSQPLNSSQSILWQTFTLVRCVASKRNPIASDIVIQYCKRPIPTNRCSSNQSPKFCSSGQSI